jgi:hypothetical protein
MRAMKHVVAIVLLVAGSVDAQSSTIWSLQASGLYVGLSGSAYDGLGGGFGAEGQVRHNFPNSWSLGGGLQYSSHSFAEGSGLDRPLTLVGVFLEPRRVIPTGSSAAAPYVSARVAFLRQSTDVIDESVSASGVQLNAGGGVLVALTRKANLDFGLTVGAVRFGDYSTGVAAGSGANLVFRAGVSVGVGR